MNPQSCIDTQMNHKLSMQQDREPLDHFRCQHRPIYTIGEGTKPNQPNIIEFCDVVEDSIANSPEIHLADATDSRNILCLADSLQFRKNGKQSELMK
uniref:Uncharacterized protein n=1 Tax=Glossina pallidipes TaxID=7398 RepID=A0A1A9ZBR8_GLOPL